MATHRIWTLDKHIHLNFSYSRKGNRDSEFKEYGRVNLSHALEYAGFKVDYQRIDGSMVYEFGTGSSWFL